MQWIALEIILEIEHTWIRFLQNPVQVSPERSAYSDARPSETNTQDIPMSCVLVSPLVVATTQNLRSLFAPCGPRFESSSCHGNKKHQYETGVFPSRCAGLDSNQRRPKSADLQSAPVDHLGTDAIGGQRLA